MMPLEETRVLRYLRTHPFSTVDEIARACVPAASREEATRILWELEWLGYVVRYGQDAVQITQKGKSAS
jgi:hypothetical protein